MHVGLNVAVNSLCVLSFDRIIKEARSKRKRASQEEEQGGGKLD